MFNKKYKETIEQKTKEISLLQKEIDNYKHLQEIKIKEIEKDHELELKEKEFELKHFKDERIKELEEETNEKNKTIAVLEKENKMLDKIVNINSDIIDIKKLVQDLIKKLPEIKLKNLYVNSNKK